jgi:hypothetical protein
MNLVPFEQIAMSAGVSLRTVARDVQRKLLVPYRQGRKALIDAEAPATVDYLTSRRAANEATQALGRRG